jgi:hypothetical protein
MKYITGKDACYKIDSLPNNQLPCQLTLNVDKIYSNKIADALFFSTLIKFVIKIA